MSGKAVMGSCAGCESLCKEISKKDRLIGELQAKLDSIHHMTRPFDATASIPERDWSRREFNFTSFNLGIDIHRELMSKNESSNGSVEGCDVNRAPTKSIKLQVIQQGNGGIPQLGNRHHEVRVITVQEIIDKVVEKSPQGSELEKNRKVDNLFDIDSMDFDEGDMTVPPKGISHDLLKRIPSGTDIRMVYNIQNFKNVDYARK